MSAIVDVWDSNLQREIHRIGELVERYPNVAIDTEFPGVVAEPVGPFKSNSDYRYQTLRYNVDMLKIIQLGLTFADEHGRLCPDTATWQFNFKFSLEVDTYAQDSINLLRGSGIDFPRFERDGIDVARFGELLMCSGLVLNENIRWLSFHSCYDFAYLLKTVTCQSLPERKEDFLEQLATYFPSIYDMKYMAQDNFRGGLNKLAGLFHVERVGQMHQAGSDSLVTLLTYFKLRESMENGHALSSSLSSSASASVKRRAASGSGGAALQHEERFAGKLYGMEEQGESSAWSPPRGVQPPPGQEDLAAAAASQPRGVVNAPTAYELPAHVHMLPPAARAVDDGTRARGAVLGAAAARHSRVSNNHQYEYVY